MVIFTSDHGEMLGDHGLLYKGCRFYEGLVRVPLLFRWPEGIRAGQVCDALTELTDLAPTILECAGLPIPERMQGRSLKAILEGQSATARHREFVRCEYYAAEHALGDGPFATMYRDRAHKLVVYHGLALGELYDLEADPGEFQNLWDVDNAQRLKLGLLKRSFDATVLAMDRGPERFAAVRAGGAS